jgi:hypothetical protein
MTESLYGLVSRHRGGAARVDKYLYGNLTEKPTWFVSRLGFLHMLGLTYLVAFLSLWGQLPGLVGEHGILPVGMFLDGVRDTYGARGYWLAPTLAWLDPSDTFLNILCAAGVMLSFLLVAGVARAPVLILLWILYLSLATIGQNFLRFQWDSLLLETGLLAIFYAPWNLRPRFRVSSPPSTIVRLLLWWLLFRLMFSSGLVKLLSGDSTWHDATALTYHYWTQPLPPWTAWYAHHWPLWFQKLSVWAVWFFEILIPIFYFAPRQLRHKACWATVIFQLLIAATGNFGFFNLLTIALAHTLLDDQRFRQGVRSWMVPPLADRRPRPWRGRILAPVGALLLLLSSMTFIDTLYMFDRRIPWPVRLAKTQEFFEPFRITSRYGLFAQMTTSRNEIIIEGSNDGATWKPYEFHFKPGDVNATPQWLGPHMPRLDWQMWFAALGTRQRNPWLVNFVHRLLEGSPEVLDLLKSNPFPEHPPKYVRASFCAYRFTQPEERQQTGAWWQRDRLALYLPAVSLEDFNPPRREDRSRRAIVRPAACAEPPSCCPSCPSRRR